MSVYVILSYFLLGLQCCGAPLSASMPVSDLSSECGVCRPVRLGLWPGPASAEAAPPHPSQLCSSHLPASVTLASLTISLGHLHRWGLTRALGTRMSMWLEPELIQSCDPRPESACIVRMGIRVKSIEGQSEGTLTLWSHQSLGYQNRK